MKKFCQRNYSFFVPNSSQNSLIAPGYESPSDQRIAGSQLGVGIVPKQSGAAYCE